MIKNNEVAISLVQKGVGQSMVLFSKYNYLTIIKNIFCTLCIQHHIVEQGARLFVEFVMYRKYLMIWNKCPSHSEKTRCIDD